MGSFERPKIKKNIDIKNYRKEFPPPWYENSILAFLRHGHSGQKSDFNFFPNYCVNYKKSSAFR